MLQKINSNSEFDVHPRESQIRQKRTATQIDEGEKVQRNWVVESDSVWELHGDILLVTACLFCVHLLTTNLGPLNSFH